MRRTHSARGTDTDTNPARDTNTNTAANTAITTTTVTTKPTDTFTAADATKLRPCISLVHWLFGAEPALVHAMSIWQTACCASLPRLIFINSLSSLHRKSFIKSALNFIHSRLLIALATDSVHVLYIRVCGAFIKNIRFIVHSEIGIRVREMQYYSEATLAMLGLEFSSHVGC